VYAAFDSEGATFRHREFAAYKAKRKKTSSELKEQFPLIEELARSFGIICLRAEGFEADDIIGTLTALITDNCGSETPTVIVTGDNDALQLVGGGVRVRTFGRGLRDVKFYDEAAVREKYGLEPSLLPDWKGLVGDGSDNLPGVPGIGPTTAGRLLKEYGSLAEIYEHLDDLSPTVAEKLRHWRKQAFLCRRLGTVRRDVPLAAEETAPKRLCPGKEKFVINRRSAEEFFARMNFRSLLSRISAPEERKVVRRKRRNRQKTEALLFPDEKRLGEFLSRFDAGEEVFFSLSAGAVALLSSDTQKRAVFFPEEESSSVWREFFSREDLIFVTYGAKRAKRELAERGVKISGKLYCVAVESYLLSSGGRQSLAASVWEAWGENIPEVKEQPDLFSSERAKIDREAAVDLLERTEYIGRLHRLYLEKIDSLSRKRREGSEFVSLLTDGKKAEWNLRSVLEKVELPLIGILAEMERAGVGFDKEAFRGVSRELENEAEKLLKRITDLVGEKFNPNSTQQTARVLFEKLTLPTEGIKKTKSGFSTAAAELAKLRRHHPVVSLLESYRELSKLKNTYIDVLPDFVSADGRIHPTFHQTVTATGRLSCSDPNLQNIPVRGAYAAAVRRAFTAGKGKRLISLDYSQIDLRCVAHLSGDREMIKAFLAGEDIHRATAAAIAGIAPSEVSAEMRREAKELNFGLIYGMGEFGFARSAGIDTGRARRFIRTYFEKFTGVAEYMKRTVEKAKETGFVETPLGRRRYLPEISSSNLRAVRAAERMAVNMPVQGFAADIIKMAMVALEKEFSFAEAEV
ncbi:MAG TPA: DNA polymerase I, partial [Candidatus Moranbacteria bacterium]|nr:DNA polymerase I [Candidatus Moranbacteria bacterium]